VLFSKSSFVTTLQLRCMVLLTAVTVVLHGVCCLQVVVMSLDITSGERNKTNVLTYVFRYDRL
jgi:succinate dehydrogenase hydrophobic anchor subunit